MDLHKQFINHIAQTSDFPLGLDIVNSEANYLIDRSGKKYLDFISGIGVSVLGHKHPAVRDAITKQLDRYLHTLVYGEFINDIQVQYASTLVKHLPHSLDNVYFVNSGAEAVEGAIKLAKRFTGRPQVISFKNAYHGSTAGALSAGGNEEIKRSFRPLIPGFQFLNFNAENQLSKINQNTAAVIIELIQGEAGAIVADPDFITLLADRCHKTGALLIVDEIQTGLGRTGKLWAFEHYHIVPDILLLGKALGGGLPLSAFIAPQKVMSCLKTNPVLGHITTTGGNPLCCAAGLATLDTLLHSKLIQQVASNEKLIRKHFVHAKIREIRGKGLMLALQLENFDKVWDVQGKCLEKGLILDWFLYNSSSIRISPPLTITTDEIKWAADVLKAVL